MHTCTCRGVNRGMYMQMVYMCRYQDHFAWFRGIFFLSFFFYFFCFFILSFAPYHLSGARRSAPTLALAAVSCHGSSGHCPGSPRRCLCLQRARAAGTMLSLRCTASSLPATMSRTAACDLQRLQTCRRRQRRRRRQRLHRGLQHEARWTPLPLQKALQSTW